IQAPGSGGAHKGIRPTANTRAGRRPSPVLRRMMDLESAYRSMALARQLDERMWRLARGGRAHFAVPSSGHEGIGVGYANPLRAGHDFVAPHYRDLAALLVIGLEPREVMLHFFA